MITITENYDKIPYDKEVIPLINPEQFNRAIQRIKELDIGRDRINKILSLLLTGSRLQEVKKTGSDFTRDSSIRPSTQYIPMWIYLNSCNLPANPRQYLVLNYKETPSLISVIIKEPVRKYLIATKKEESLNTTIKRYLRGTFGTLQIDQTLSIIQELLESIEYRLNNNTEPPQRTRIPLSIPLSPYRLLTNNMEA